jgi:hypothetical protein
MPKYLLLKDHFLNGALVPEGTVVGEGTTFPFNDNPKEGGMKPGMFMKEVEDVSAKLPAKPPPTTAALPGSLAKPLHPAMKPQSGPTQNPDEDAALKNLR